MTKHFAIALAVLMVSGCGAQVRMTAAGKANPAFRAQTRGTIVELPGVAIGAEQKVAGKFKTYKIAGTGTVKALDDAHLDVAAKLSAKVAMITVTKNVTFAITRRTDTTWPYQFTTVNLTDKETFNNKAQLVSAVNNQSTFKMDDGTTSLIAADGKGNVRVVNGDFDLTFGAGSKAGALGPTIHNAPGLSDWFAN